MEISEVNPDGNVYQLKDATARTEIAQIKAQDAYSTAEIDTGRKWIDGKTIYRRVLTATGTTVVDTNWKTISGWSIGTNTLNSIISMIPISSSVINGMKTRYDSDTLQFAMQSSSTTVEPGNCCIIEYTKPQ